MPRNLCFSLAALLIATALAAAQPCQWVHGTEQQAPGFASTHGIRVDAQTVWDPDGPGPMPERLVMGGGGLNGLLLTTWDGERWEDLSGLTGHIQALAVFNGDLIAAGNISSTQQPGINGLARFDGVEWHSTGIPGSTTSTKALAVHDQHLYIILTQTVDGHSIWRWDGQTWSGMGSLLGSPRAMTVHDGVLYVGTIHDRIWRLDGTQWILLPHGPCCGGITALASANGKLIAGTALGTVYAWTGSDWTQLGPTLHRVEAITDYNGAIIVGTGYIPSVRRWTGTEWLVLGEGIVYDDRIASLIEFQGELHVGGEFLSINGKTAAHVGRFNGAEWRPLGDAPDRYIRTFATYQGQRIVGGAFRVLDQSIARGLAVETPSGWSELGGGVRRGLGVAMWSWVDDALEHDNELIIAGWFSHAGGNAGASIATWNGSEWNMMGGGLTKAGQPGEARALAIYNGGIAVAGDFDAAGGIPTANIAFWDGQAWHAIGTGLDDAASSLYVMAGDLYAGGTFENAGGAPAARIARWDGSSWSSVGDGLNHVVHALGEYHGQLIAGGSFTFSGGIPMRGLARLDGQQWQPVPHDFTTAQAFTIHNWNDMLLLGGWFAGGAMGPDLSGLIAWNGSTWSTLASGKVNNRVDAIASDGAELLVGGWFTHIGSDMAWNLARLSCEAPCYANCDGSTVEPILNVDDFTCFINNFAEAMNLPHEQQLTHYANCDGSTVAPVLNVDDFTCFINAFAAGCS